MQDVNIASQCNAIVGANENFGRFVGSRKCIRRTKNCNRCSRSVMQAGIYDPCVTLWPGGATKELFALRNGTILPEDSWSDRLEENCINCCSWFKRKILSVISVRVFSAHTAACTSDCILLLTLGEQRRSRGSVREGGRICDAIFGCSSVQCWMAGGVHQQSRREGAL